ncbi:MAG: hypothetical protein EPO22_12325 [Dehalococcoidia bacterium]|nr:MAG: hypothetical protein EPO22_12325 [Dehalococcoidia bacterium]
MGLRSHCWNDRVREWVDRVVPGDVPFDEASPDIDRLVNDATEIGRMAVECCIEPLREILADLPRIISIEVKGRHPERFASEWDI